MPAAKKNSAKAKITLSLDAKLVKAIDAIVSRSEHRSRSSAVEHVLQQWYEEQLRSKLEEETERYYSSLTEGEKEEDRKWTRTAARQVKHLWE